MRVRTAPDWLTQYTYAHRGLHSANVIENSPSAFEAAIAAGLGIECDIQMSRDNVPHVFHDWELDRLTNVQGKVANQSAEFLGQLTLGSGNDRIWTLAELLDSVAGRAPTIVEVKSRPDFDVCSACVAVSAAIEGYNGSLAVMSFDPRVGEWFADNAPETVRGLVCTDTLDHGFLHAWREPKALERAQPDFLAVDARDLPNAICSVWRDAGHPLLTWTVRTDQLRETAKVHADAAIAEGEGLA